MYLVAIMDWYSRYVIAWQLSNSLETRFCLEALEDALLLGKPEIFNSDRGSQYTSQLFTQKLSDAGIQISMASRLWDNIFVERLWRTVKYEDIYLKEYGNGLTLFEGLRLYFQRYNQVRLHSSLDYQTPQEVYFG